MTSSLVNAAVVQAGSVVFDTPATLVRLSELTREAAGRGADIVVFPEAFVGGYPKGLDFGTRLGSRTPEGREDFRRYYESAIEIGDAASAHISAVARDNRVHLVVGVIERGGATLYCTVLMYAPDGTLLGKHRKVMPTALERLVWGFGDGSTLTVVDTPNVVGHYARPELFHLSVNSHELEAIAFDSDSAKNNRSHGCSGRKRGSSDTGERPRQ
jgi:nitrilase